MSILKASPLRAYRLRRTGDWSVEAEARDRGRGAVERAGCRVLAQVVGEIVQQGGEVLELW